MKLMLKNKISANKYLKYFFTDRIFYIFVIVILLFFVINTPIDKKSVLISHDNLNKYEFTNPILDCEFEFENSSLILGDLDKEINKLQKKYDLDSTSFYYRELNNGVWLGFNEKEYFSPASMLKVPILISFLKNTEQNPDLLNKKIVVGEKDFVNNVSANFVADNLLVKDKEYSLLQVAEHLIQKSDNTAISILYNNTAESYGEDIFKSIGINLKETADDTQIKVKEQASLFRVLFNASYLNREMSELALSILSKSEFKNDMTARLPKNIKVAHKFGERKIAGNKNNIQLHDCGIVYYPDHPYIFCVMTRGSDFNSQSRFIGDLSKFVFDQVDKNNDFVY